MTSSDSSGSDPRAAFLANPEILSSLHGRVARLVPEDAVEDVAHDAVEKALLAESSPTERKPFIVWLNSLGFTAAVKFLRKRTRRRSREELVGEALDEIPGACVVSHYEARDGLPEVQREFDEQAVKPGARQAAAWLLRRLEGYSYEQIAAESNASVNAVQQAVKRVRRRLRDGVGAALLAVFLFLCLRSQLARKDEAQPPEPTPAPTVAPAPAPAPVSDARDIREKALVECDSHDWLACRTDLARARQLDPDGERDPRVIAARKALRSLPRTPDIKP